MGRTINNQNYTYNVELDDKRQDQIVQEYSDYLDDSKEQARKLYAKVIGIIVGGTALLLHNEIGEVYQKGKAKVKGWFKKDEPEVVSEQEVTEK